MDSVYTHNKFGPVFFIPFISDDDDDETQGEAGDNDPLHPLKEWRVCKNAISVLLDYGIWKWQTCQEAILQNKLPTHSKKGKVLGKAKRFADHVKDDLHSFFQHIKQFGAPKATRFVREETGTGLRDGEDDLVELPTSWSKRAMYARFCFERGYVITTNARGSAIKTERSDANWRVEDQKMICSWWAFLVFWDTNYPKIRLGSPSADICTDCHIFFNRTKYAAPSDDSSDTNTTRNNQLLSYNPLQEENDNDDNNDNNLEEQQPQCLQIENQQELLERESIITKASLHVRQAAIQRQLANKKIQEAIDTADLPHSQRTYTFIADFSQNMELPFFGESQPGDTYYFSPLKINVFGIVDCSVFGGKLSAHVYDEGVAKKGGNNIASMLINEFKRLNIMREHETGKELTIVMDNCSGQNKNRMVLRLANYLVEAEYFEKVSFVFLIVGHTKNACDRWFNQLKRNYRRWNIYSFDQLIDSLKTHTNINVTRATVSDFQDWDKFLNSQYKLLDSGETTKNHIFTAEKENKTLLLRRIDALPETQTTTQDMLKKGRNTPQRFDLLRSPPLETIIPPGIPAIKQVELFSKYRSLLPVQFHDITCPDPGADVKDKIKQERNTKQRERKKSKMEIGKTEVKATLMEEATI